MKLPLLYKMLLWILLPSLLGLSAVTIGSYMQAKGSLDTQIAEELKQTVLSETSQLKSVTTDLLMHHFLCRTHDCRGLARCHAFCEPCGRREL